MERGHDAFLLGSYATTGWWYYFLVAFLVKTPPGTLLLLLIATPFAIDTARRGWTANSSGIAFLLVPLTTILVITAIWPINSGLRHLLPIYPFLFVFIGWMSARFLARRRGKIGVCLVAACLAYNSWEAAGISPYDLTYFNVLGGGPQDGPRLLSDSNIDWGQAAKALKAYVDRQGVSAIYCAVAGSVDPWYYGVRYQYVPGPLNLNSAVQRGYRVPSGLPRELFAISVTTLQGLYLSDHQAYAWLRDRTPVDRVANAMLIDDITRDDGAHAHFAYSCFGYGLYPLAAHEAQRALEINPGNVQAKTLLLTLNKMPPAVLERR